MGVHVHFKATVWIIVLHLLVLGSFEPIDAKPDKGLSGIKAGLFGGGTIELGPKHAREFTNELRTSDSYSLGVFFEQPVYRHLRAAVSIDIHDVKQDIWIGSFSETLIDLGLGLKMGGVTSDGRLGLRPGLTMGFGYLRDVDRLGLEPTTYLTVKAYSEFVFYTAGGTGLLFELGLFWAPSGGNGDVRMAAGPMALMRFGLLFQRRR